MHIRMIKMNQQNKIKEYVHSLKWSYFGLLAGVSFVVLAFSTTSVFLMWSVGLIGACVTYISGVQMAVTIEDLSKTTIEKQRTRTSKRGKNEK